MRPPAEAARSGGAEPMISRALGARNRPKPAPVTTIRQARSKYCGSAGSQAKLSSPTVAIVMPMPPSRPAGYLSDRAPASGATNIVVSGHGAMIAPTSDGREAELMLQAERQREQQRHRRDEGGEGADHRKRHHRRGEQIDRHDRARLVPLAADEDDADDDADADDRRGDDRQIAVDGRLPAR